MSAFATLVDFNGNNNEKWMLPNIPNKGDDITIKGLRKTVVKVSYVFSTYERKDICDIYIHTVY